MRCDAEARLAFADFLLRLADDLNNEEWKEFVVEHYPDLFLEEIRRCVVRLRHYSPVVWGSTESNERLEHWADLLRLSIEADLCTPDYSQVALKFTASEFVILDSMMRRFSESDELSINDPAERQTLYNLQCLCERFPGHSQMPEHDIARRELLGE